MLKQATIGRRYHFESGHWLPKVPEGHKCRRPHGHNYKMDVVLSGPVDSVGFVIDFWDLDKIVDPIVQVVDHRQLNEIEGLENPTAEYIADWFLGKISLGLPGWKISIQIEETENCWAIVKNF